MASSSPSSTAPSGHPTSTACVTEVTVDSMAPTVIGSAVWSLHETGQRQKNGGILDGDLDIPGTCDFSSIERWLFVVKKPSKTRSLFQSKEGSFGFQVNSVYSWDPPRVARLMVRKVMMRQTLEFFSDRLL